jgi:hypothetical protein
MLVVPHSLIGCTSSYRKRFVAGSDVQEACKRQEPLCAPFFRQKEDHTAGIAVI